MPPSESAEAALTGASAARRLYREITADPSAPLLLEIVGPGGSGKSVLLDVLERRYTESGVPVGRDAGARVGGNGAVAAGPEGALLLDDAHLLPEQTLRALAAAVRAGTIDRLLLTRRPYPRTTALGELTAELADRRAPLPLGDLDRAGVGGRGALAAGARPAAGLVDAVLGWTGGSPALVDRVLAALTDAGALDTVRPGDPPPGGLLEQLGHQLERLPEPLRQLTLACAAGAPLDVDVLAPVLGSTAAEVAGLVEQADAAGWLVGDPGGLRPVYALAALRVTPPVRLLSLRRRLAEVQLERGASVMGAALHLLGSGATGARVAGVFTTAADEALRDDPPGSVHPGYGHPGAGGPVLAGRLLDAAVAAGAPAVELAARRAEAAARAGDLDRALELADHVLSDPGAVSEADRSRAVTVAAAALAQRGLLARSAELYRWLGAASMGANAVVAVPALIGTGALAEARELLEPAAGSAPASVTLLAGAEALLARGVYDTVAGSPTAALSQLARAAALLEPRASSVLLPDTPAALAALVAAHCGELDVAASVLDRAVATGLGGAMSAARHRLLQGWVLMSRGATVAARGLLAEVDAGVAARATRHRRLEPRDELVAAALEVGLARRAGDLAALMPAWGRAREAIVRHPVDLYVLQPLGELIVAAARLREQSWVQPHLDEAHALLARLGHPVLWSASVHWAELHAALIAERPDEATRHAEALERGAAGGRYVAALAVAARQWIAALAGEVDPPGVEAAARGLHAVGLSWEGGKLAGQAAIRTTDRKAMSALLQCARGLQATASATDPGVLAGPGAGGGAPVGTVGSARPSPNGGSGPPPHRAGDRSGGAAPERRPDAPSRPGAAPPSRPAAAAGPGASANGPRAGSDAVGGTLSDREVEVAQLVLAGMTYKEIGERLFISAKTVEHHVARMRQRLGATSRGELMAHLRMIVNN